MEKLEIMIKLASDRNIDQVHNLHRYYRFLNGSINFLGHTINANPLDCNFSGPAGVQRVCH